MQNSEKRAKRFAIMEKDVDILYLQDYNDGIAIIRRENSLFFLSIERNVSLCEEGYGKSVIGH